MWGVADSAYQWCLESATPHISDVGSRGLRVSVMRGVGDSPYHWYAESVTPRIVDSGRVVFQIRMSLRIRSKNRSGSKCSVRDSWGTNFCKNPRKSTSLPCPFNNYTITETSFYARNSSSAVRLGSVHGFSRLVKFRLKRSTSIKESRGLIFEVKLAMKDGVI